MPLEEIRSFYEAQGTKTTNTYRYSYIMRMITGPILANCNSVTPTMPGLDGLQQNLPRPVAILMFIFYKMSTLERDLLTAAAVLLEGQFL